MSAGRWVSVTEKLPGEGWAVEVVQAQGGKYFQAKFYGGDFYVHTVFGIYEQFPDGWVAFWRGNLGVRSEDLS